MAAGAAEIATRRLADGALRRGDRTRKMVGGGRRRHFRRPVARSKRGSVRIMNFELRGARQK